MAGSCPRQHRPNKHGAIEVTGAHLGSNMARQFAQSMTLPTRGVALRHRGQLIHGGATADKYISMYTRFFHCSLSSDRRVLTWSVFFSSSVCLLPWSVSSSSVCLLFPGSVCLLFLVLSPSLVCLLLFLGLSLPLPWSVSSSSLVCLPFFGLSPPLPWSVSSSLVCLFLGLSPPLF